MFDTEKLDKLRDAHIELVERFRAISARARSAATEAAALKNTPLQGTEQQRAIAEALMALPMTELEKHDPAELKAVGVDLMFMRQIVSAERRAASLKADAAALASKVHNSAALLQKLESYANRS